MTDNPIINNPGSPIILPTQQESIEITRNSKGYNWTIKMIGIDLERLKEKTDLLNKLYPIMAKI